MPGIGQWHPAIEEALTRSLAPPRVARSAAVHFVNDAAASSTTVPLKKSGLTRVFTWTGLAKTKSRKSPAVIFAMFDTKNLCTVHWQTPIASRASLYRRRNSEGPSRRCRRDKDLPEDLRQSTCLYQRVGERPVSSLLLQLASGFSSFHQNSRNELGSAS
jgi:hypothetical protein